jgi:hypothetical protein
VKPLAEFYARKFRSGTYGTTANCKACIRASSAARRAADPTENRDRLRAYRATPEGHARQAASRRASRERRRERALEQQRQSRLRHVPHEKARQEVRWALDAGRIERESCLFCDDPDTQAHHHSYAPEDRLNVTWLCRKHHGLVHRQVDEPVIAEAPPRGFGNVIVRLY